MPLDGQRYVAADMQRLEGSQQCPKVGYMSIILTTELRKVDLDRRQARIKLVRTFALKNGAVEEVDFDWMATAESGLHEVTSKGGLKRPAPSADEGVDQVAADGPENCMLHRGRVLTNNPIVQVGCVEACPC